MLAYTLTHAQGDVYKIKICLIYKGELKTVEGEYSTGNGRYSVILEGKKVYTDSMHIKNPDYAATAKWYINNETIEVNKVKYQKYGLPRVLSSEEIVKYTEYKAVGIYREAGYPGTPAPTGIPDVIYVPIKAQCEFQPYAKLNN